MVTVSIWRRLFSRIYQMVVVLCCVTTVLAMEKVSLQLKWTHQFQFAGYYAAVEQGYYREAGLDVELKEALPGQDTAREVTRGNADFGVGTSNLVVLRSQGEPVVVLAVIYQHSPFVLASMASSGIRDIHDLSTRRVMMESDAVELLAYFKHEGIDLSKINVIPHSFDLEDLTSGKVDAIASYSTGQLSDLIEAGADYRLFDPRAGGIDFYGDNLFTTEKQLRENPERVKKFLHASLMGWTYAMGHPQEMIDLILKKYPRGRSRANLQFEADESAKLIHPELIEVGHINRGRWQNIADTYAELGMLPHPVNVKDFIYDRDPKRDLRWLYGVGAGLGVLAAVLGGWSLLTTRMNRRLRQEIAARKEAEEHVLAENSAKTHFLSVLAHEVRTPLSGILSSLWLYRNSTSQSERDAVVRIAETSSTHLLRLVDQTLDHSALEISQFEVEHGPVALNDFLQEIIDLFQIVASSKSVELILEIDPSVPEAFTTDPIRLRQILSNLISNAVKFTMEGHVRLRVAPGGGGDRNSLAFTVSDTGPGISPELAEKIFEPYVRGGADGSRNHGGAGLGLSISSQLARLLGGEIELVGPRGRGAVFVLTLPADT